MSTGEGSDFRFACPECGESLAVNAAMRDALLERGCVVCGSSVTDAAFSKDSSTTRS